MDKKLLMIYINNKKLIYILIDVFWMVSIFIINYLTLYLADIIIPLFFVVPQRVRE